MSTSAVGCPFSRSQPAHSPSYSLPRSSYPFSSYKLIFVEDAVTDAHNAATMGVFSADLLHPASVIDQALETRQILSHALATQWVGINIIQRSWSDTWLINVSTSGCEERR